MKGLEDRLVEAPRQFGQRMLEVLDAEPLLEGGVVDRWEARPRTRFERRGVADGRPITDLAYRRR